MEPPQTHPPPNAPSAFDPLFAGLSLAIPLLVTVLGATEVPTWRNDLSLVRSLGFVSAGGEGTLSGLLAQLASLLPVGGRVMRAGLVSAIGVGVGSWLVYRLARRTLDDNLIAPRLTPALAFCAALTVGFSPSWQAEGSTAGGATWGAALALLVLSLRPVGRRFDARMWLLLGVGTALVASESRAAGLSLLVALAVATATSSQLPSPRSAGLFVLGSLVAIGVLSVPMVLRPMAARAWVDFGLQLSTAPLTAAAEAGPSLRPGPLSIWFEQVGVLSLALAVAGIAWGLFRPRTRRLIAPLSAFVLGDALWPAGESSALVADSLMVLRLLAVAALAIAAALSVQTVAVGLVRARIPLGQPAAVLLVVFNVTLVLVTAEETPKAIATGASATEIWTDEALGRLPRRSLLLVRSPAIAWRLWAARVTRGQRPDVVIVPMSLLAQGSLASRLLELEPALGPVMREIAVNGRPSEYALSALADVRPLFVELDPTWDRRLLDHLRPEPLWLGFAPHALGRSDRRVALNAGRTSFRRILSAARSDGGEDRATLAVLSGRAHQQAVALAAVGDRTNLGRVVRDLRAIDPQDPFVTALDERVRARRRGRVDARDLLQ